MPKYSFVVKDREGKTYKNVFDAPSQTAAVEKLQKQEYFIISIKEISAPSVLKEARTKSGNKRKFTHNKVNLQDLLTIARQLSTMLQAGVTLHRSLDVIQSQITSEQLFNVLGKVNKDVEQGNSLSMALAKHPKVFNQFWVSLMEVGEASGSIPTVLDKLSFYLEQQARFRATIISGLIYPAILFSISMGAIMFFALFVGPRFESIFKQMNAELPAITVVLLATFNFIKAKFLLLSLGIGGGIFILRKYLQTYHGQIQFEKFLFNLPKVGEIFTLIVVERFASQMAILIEAGVPILYALDICERMVENFTCSLIINNIKEGVKKGQSLVDPMEKSGFFPPMAIQMISVGEETGELSKMFKHVSEFYQQSVETFMKRFSTIIEPFMLVFMGVVIGVIVVAMFLPMFNIAQLGGAGS